MTTIYDLLQIEEDATKEDIEKAYVKMLSEYPIDPNGSIEDNKTNEFIRKKLKMAYDILVDEAKREKYDKILATQKQDELIKGISRNTEESKKVESTENNAQEVVEEVKTDNSNNYQNNTKLEVMQKQQRQDLDYDDEIVEESNYKQPQVVEEKQNIKFNDELTEEEQQQLKDAAQAEFNANLKRVQQAEEEYKKAYKSAYDSYIKQSAKDRVMTKVRKYVIITISIVVILIVCRILWAIPAINSMLVNLYNTNIFIKVFVDIIVGIVNAIGSIFKK